MPIAKSWWKGIVPRPRTHDKSLSYSQYPCLLLECLGNSQNLEPMKQKPNKTKATGRFHKFTHQREPRITIRTHLPRNWVTPRAISPLKRLKGWNCNSGPIIPLGSWWWLHLFTIANHLKRVVPSGLAVIASPLKLIYLESLNLGLVSQKH